MYEIELTNEAIRHLGWLTKQQEAIVMDAIPKQLAFEPTVVTRNRKVLRPNPIAPRELRVGDLRVFYDVAHEPLPIVRVVAVGVKQGSRLFIGGEEVDLS